MKKGVLHWRSSYILYPFLPNEIIYVLNKQVKTCQWPFFDVGDAFDYFRRHNLNSITNIQNTIMKSKHHCTPQYWIFWFRKIYVWKLIHSELSTFKIGTEFNKFSFFSMNSYGSFQVHHFVFSYLNAIRIEKELNFKIDQQSAAWAETLQF